MVFGTIFICSTLLVVQSREDLDGEAAALVQTTKGLDLATEANGDNIVMELTAKGDAHQLTNEEFDKFDEGIFDLKAWKKKILSSKEMVDQVCAWVMGDIVSIAAGLGGTMSVGRALATYNMLNSEKPIELALPAFITDMDMAKVKKFATKLCGIKQELEWKLTEWKGRYFDPCQVTLSRNAREAVEASDAVDCTGKGWWCLEFEAVEAVEATEEKHWHLNVSHPDCEGRGEELFDGYKKMDACHYDWLEDVPFDSIQMSWGCKLAVVVPCNEENGNEEVKHGESLQWIGWNPCSLIIVPATKTMKQKWAASKKTMKQKWAATKKKMKQKWAALKRKR